MATGTVKWFNPSKGFGFISQDEAGKDVFVHSNELNGVYINEGDNVEFEIVETEKGLSAQNIKKLYDSDKGGIQLEFFNVSLLYLNHRM